jgi:type III secretory pathway component EscR
MQNNAQGKLAENRAKVWASLDENLAQYKEGLKKANEKRQGNDFNPSDKDKSNRETLETMSSMAQKIDEDNQ